MQIDTSEFWQEIHAENARSFAKYQHWPSDAVYGSAIISEETGKLTQACIDAERRRAESGSEISPADIERIQEYAVRVAANAMTLYHFVGLNREKSAR